MDPVCQQNLLDLESIFTMAPEKLSFSPAKFDFIPSVDWELNHKFCLVGISGIMAVNRGALQNRNYAAQA